MKKQDVFSVPMKGIVVDNNDPKKLGRVKVRITGLLEDPDKTKLPWILPKNPAGFGGKPDGSGLVAPDINAELVVEFPYKSIYFAFYTGYWQSATTHQGLFTEDYPESYGFRDTQSSFIKVNRAKSYVQMRHRSGTQLDNDRDGNLEVQSPKTMKFVSEDGKTEIFFDQVNGKILVHPRDSSEERSPDHLVNVDKHRMILGTHKADISGSSDVTVLGAVRDKCGGSRSISTVGNESKVTTGKTTSTMAQDVEETYGMSKKQTYVVGNKIAKLLLGNHEISVLVGDIIHKTLAGNMEQGNPLANFKYSIAGQAAYKSTLDTTIEAMLNLNAKGQLNVNITAGLQAIIKASVLAEVKAALVKLGQGTAPVLTVMTDPLVDYITGAPHIGVPTVLAG